MSNLNCRCRSNCTGIAVAASIIIGIITGFLRFSAAITVTPAFLWVLFGIAVVYLAVTVITSAALRTTSIQSCLCSNLPVLLTGILGTILTSIVLLAITFVATSVTGAIITGILLTFFSLIITSTACLVKCISGCYDD